MQNFCRLLLISQAQSRYVNALTHLIFICYLAKNLECNKLFLRHDRIKRGELEISPTFVIQFRMKENKQLKCTSELSRWVENEIIDRLQLQLQQCDLSDFNDQIGAQLIQDQRTRVRRSPCDRFTEMNIHVYGMWYIYTQIHLDD